MKNKLLIKKYYFCKRKEDAAMTLINYYCLIKTSLPITIKNCEL